MQKLLKVCRIRSSMTRVHNRSPVCFCSSLAVKGREVGHGLATNLERLASCWFICFTFSWKVLFCSSCLVRDARRKGTGNVTWADWHRGLNMQRAGEPAWP